MGILKKYPTLFLGLSVTFIFLAFGYRGIDFLDTVELKLYDIRMNLRSMPEGSDEIVLVDIDNDSIEKIGRWPWPRSHIAKGIAKITAAEPKIIGLNIIYSEPEESSAVKELNYLLERLTQLDPNPAEAVQAVRDSLIRLDNDGKLSESLKESNKVVLPVFFKESERGEKNVYIKSQSLPNVGKPEGAACPRGDKILTPIPVFLEASKGLGHVNLAFDIDGKVRREQLLYEYDGLYFPSFTLRLAALYLDIPNEEIKTVLGKTVSLGFLEIPMSLNSELLVSFKGPANSFKRYSFYDVINDKIGDMGIFKNKIVLITPSAAGIQNPVSTPTAQAMSVGEFSANTIWAMLNRRFVTKPSWDSAATLVMIAIIGVIITFVLPRLKAVFSGLTFAGLLLFIIGGSFYAFATQGLWIRITYPLLQLILGYIGVVSIRYFVTETRKDKIEGESAENNRMLGLTFQSQGMLDMAFDKLRKVPVDNEMKGVLYNLGLDYERKRQFNKAAAVYEYIEGFDPEYKDVGNRKRKLMQASDTMVFGDGFLTGSSTGGDNLLAGGSDTRPTLGRYEVSKQLGKGAMGVVYLGMDPRINRTTAIKTFRFSEDLDAEEVKALKQKFFREAESAGTLAHPNIVTIYDAGEEQDLAYISMEYLEGEDLQKFTKKNNLLPMRKVLDYVADIAEALDYAHEKGIIHRDVKPANIMLLKTGIVKITDFGIARITASSQTQTGVVKGTPHYMSPEQISGEKVDGRSDIFSLGVMLFQLLTGDVPFHGNSPAALLHQIMNVPHPDPRKINPKLLKPHVAIIDKAMEKDREKRYQKASQMAAHLRALGKKLDALKANKSEK